MEEQFYLTAANPSAAYFLTPTRPGSSAPALLALWDARRRTRAELAPGVPAALATTVSWLGLLTLAACGLLYDQDTPFPGTAAQGDVLLDDRGDEL